MKTMPINLIHLFSGIGAFEKALEKMDADFNVVNYCEINKHASLAYSLIHNVPEFKNLGDITKVNEKELPKDIDLVCYGFPCQDISLAGNQRGLFNKDGSKTRSGLFFDALRIINEIKPKVAIAENVKHLLSIKFADSFNLILDELDKAGYNNYYFLTNAKDYGIPQRRERVFIISIRKDIDIHTILDPFFISPIKSQGERILSDFLDKEWDKKYILSERILKHCIYKIPEDKDVLLIKCATRLGYQCAYEGDGVDIGSRCKYHRGTVQYQSVGTIMTSGNDRGVVYRNKETNRLEIRKLTPCECIKLMGFEERDYQILRDSKISESQIFHMAGNSIVVNVVYEILNKLITEGIL